MLPPVTPAASASPSGVVAAPMPARRGAGEAASAVVMVSAAGAQAAARDTAKVATGVVHVTADVNHDGTVSDQEQQTETAQLALKRALMEGGANLGEALEAYQSVASLADVQR